MGYCTWFTGHFTLDKPLAPHHLAYLQAFSQAEHFHWDVELLKKEPDPLREAVGLPLGENGCYFTGDRAQFSHRPDPFAGLRYSYPPWIYNGNAETDPAYLSEVCPGIPHHRCGWAPSDDGMELVANVDKFYGYIEWLQYLLDHFFVPWGYRLSGEMTWQGEWEDDTGTLLIEENVITVHKANS